MFISTRDNTEKVHASTAIMRGMVPEGGLYFPETLPSLSLADFEAHLKDSYQDLAKWVLGLLLDDFSEEEVAHCVDAAYNDASFDHADIAPVVKLTESSYVLELWHGPTAAFKDMALQILPHLLVTSMRKNDCKEKVVILVATSGDTGKAALEGFKNVEDTEIIVFYPHEGVSHMQELQMVTTDGTNTHVVAVKGNFDDCQRAVKEIFVDETMIQAIGQKGYRFSSANSINWGRLAPQVVYYISTYLNLVRREQIRFGDKLQFSVPSGNFGNLLAGWIAKAMGLPVSTFICASNANNVLTKFFTTGVYDSKLPFLRTISPSIDILVSSNLERYLYAKSGRDGAQVASWMQDLREKGGFEVPEALRDAFEEDILAINCDDEVTKATIREVYEETHYLLDTHTAVAAYAAKALSKEPVVICATANPYKFVEAVYEALHPDQEGSHEDALALLKTLEEETKTPIHPALRSLGQSCVRPHRIIEQAEINETVLAIIDDAQ